MQAHETTALTTADHAQGVCKRFVHNVFLVIKRAHLDAFHGHINNLYLKIQFTIEHEKNVLVYCKPTYTDQYLNDTSNHQMSCKESVVSSLLDRAVNVVSGNNTLLANGYLRQTIKKVERKIRNRTDKSSNGEDAKN
ncbi:uncharacterized protein LOC130653836 [Hydractinia symbiolongicarpus]|uniref:uncharacterized protein LOC130653836 n=1 Tax=Hydractinia symbiolongicarpus TaxID=13093 RepID=UPI00255155D8|nr:uncharacterized protein LOC130653836 [Hydractinia symbiolongicarpus]